MASRVSASILATVVCLGTTVQAADSGSFSFLSYNVAGLPFIDNGVPGDKKDNAGHIGEKLAEQGYDIVHLQEDFNFNPWLYAKDNHEFRTDWTGPIPFGSGLNTVANYDWSKFERIKWDDCDINEADCLTPKGFTFMRIRIDDVDFDLYNLHADAGDKQGDHDARASNINQMLEHIDANDEGNPVILAGDFNQRWYSEVLSIDKLRDEGFEDAWAVVVRGGDYPESGSDNIQCNTPADNNECEVVDKFFFRSSDAIELNATSFSYAVDVFVQPSGDKLSDHNPVLVEFEWTKA